MATFPRACPELEFAQTPSAQISWSHITLMLDKVLDSARRHWYADQTYGNGWSVRDLASIISLPIDDTEDDASADKEGDK